MDLDQYLVTSVKIVLKLATLLSRSWWVLYLWASTQYWLYIAILTNVTTVNCRISLKLPEKEVFPFCQRSLMEYWDLGFRRSLLKMLCHYGVFQPFFVVSSVSNFIVRVGYGFIFCAFNWPVHHKITGTKWWSKILSVRRCFLFGWMGIQMQKKVVN